MTETKPFNISKRAVMTAYKTKHDNLKKLGINEYKAWEYANTRKGYWRISKSPILSKTLTNKYLKEPWFIFKLSQFYYFIT